MLTGLSSKKNRMLRTDFSYGRASNFVDTLLRPVIYFERNLSVSQPVHRLPSDTTVVCLFSLR